SYLSQSELPLTFGLGKPDENRAVSLEIIWPSGKKETVTNIKPNRFITVQEGKGVTTSEPILFSGPPSHP
ncbi:ASPIC/UnbV domain-containing protein, partial [Acidobacterium sp. S8]|uniref:ASPIC/UnbV domain-containing protein n=1 Tax=Acidobacterium sp. S8 TaxID=1641854 RepID=UPI0015756CAA